MLILCLSSEYEEAWSCFCALWYSTLGQNIVSRYDFYLVGFVLEKMVCSFKKTILLFMVLIFRSEDLTRCHWRWKIMIFIRLTLCQFNVISCADEFHIGRLCIHALDKGNLVWLCCDTATHTPQQMEFIPKLLNVFLASNQKTSSNPWRKSSVNLANCYTTK